MLHWTLGARHSNGVLEIGNGHDNAVLEVVYGAW